MSDITTFRGERTTTIDQAVSTATAALATGDQGLRDQIDRLDVPVYMTDADGWITYFNPACVKFAGRTPAIGRDRWCVTWRLHTEAGAPLPHSDCPMATAIKEKRPVRGVAAIAERPDGSRARFSPLPTPILDSDGWLLGAVNLLLQTDDPREARALKAQADRCRRLAASVSDPQTVTTLTRMAADYEDQARSLRLN